MIYSIYSFFKALVQDIPGVKAVQWRNVQYGATVPAGDTVLIEVLPIDFLKAVKESKGVMATVRLHIIDKAISATDGSIPESRLQAHSVMCGAIIEALEGAQYESQDGKSRRLSLALLQTPAMENGWLVTLLDFPVKI
jgi:hypothetical protein